MKDTAAAEFPAEMSRSPHRRFKKTESGSRYSDEAGEAGVDLHIPVFAADATEIYAYAQRTAEIARLVVMI